MIGMHDYISKPVKPDELETLLEHWISPSTITRVVPNAEEGDVKDLVHRTEPTINHDVIEGLRELQGNGEADILAELVELFLDDTPSRLADLREALNREGLESLERTAHALKSSCVNLGAQKVTRTAEHLEEMRGMRKLDSAPNLLKKVQA